MPFLDPTRMASGEPLPGWKGRFFHSGHMTFSHYDVAADAKPLHTHAHPQEEVWNVVAGQLALTVDGEERTVGPGSAVVVPSDTPHSVRPITGFQVVVVDFPLRESLPGGLRLPPD